MFSFLDFYIPICSLFAPQTVFLSLFWRTKCRELCCGIELKFIFIVPFSVLYTVSVCRCTQSEMCVIEVA